MFLNLSLHGKILTVMFYGCSYARRSVESAGFLLTHHPPVHPGCLCPGCSPIYFSTYPLMPSPIHLPMCLSTHSPIYPLSTHRLSSHNHLTDTPLPHVSTSQPSTISGSACISYNPRLPSTRHHPYQKPILSFPLPKNSRHKLQT